MSVEEFNSENNSQSKLWLDSLPCWPALAPWQFLMPGGNFQRTARPCRAVTDRFSRRLSPQGLCPSFRRINPCCISRAVPVPRWEQGIAAGPPAPTQRTPLAEQCLLPLKPGSRRQECGCFCAPSWWCTLHFLWFGRWLLYKLQSAS